MMMNDITAQVPHFPGALSDDAVALFRVIQRDYMWIPDVRQMSKAQMEALHLLVKSGYIVSSGWYGFRARNSGLTGYSVPTPAQKDDLREVVSIAIGGRSALVEMSDGRKLLFKVSDKMYLRDLDQLARSMSKPHPVAHNGPLIYRNDVRKVG